ncbi:MAG: DNA primase [Deltaproteobacteria bacterium]|nr:DNA primase [Deltaproteobacteria bacterium]
MSELNQIKSLILSQAPLDQLIGEHVRLQNRGGRRMGCCPFHAEKTPSFYLYDDHYHCFGCGAHGDAISWVRHSQGLGFVDSLRWLAEKYGLDASGLDKEQQGLGVWKEAARKTKILAEAQEFFQLCLHRESGQLARDYLISRGFSEETWKLNGFGYSPDAPDSLVRRLSQLGYDIAEMEAASLANRFRNRSFDFFRHRLMIPIRDAQGRLLAFGGRALGDQQQKYKNSRYDKGSVLFGLDHARKFSNAHQRIIVVEGYLDALKMRMSGFPETVACQGTALTREHLRALPPTTPEVILLFDGDQAGQKASLKTVEQALDFPGMAFRVAILPAGEDPDSFLKKNPPDQMETLLASAEALLAWSIRKQLDGADSGAVPALINREIIPWLLRISDPVNRSYLEDQVASLSGVPVSVIREAISGRKPLIRKENYPEIPQAATEPSLQTEAKPASLSPLAFEFCGHVFYTDPSDVSVPELIDQIRLQHLEEDPLWLSLLEEFSESLRAGVSPSDRDDYGWALAASPFVTKLLLKLRSLSPAFRCSDRKKIFERLQLLFVKNNIENAIVSAKARVAQLGLSQAQENVPESMREHINALMQLQKRLREVGQSLHKSQ